MQETEGLRPHLSSFWRAPGNDNYLSNMCLSIQKRTRAGACFRRALRRQNAIASLPSW